MGAKENLEPLSVMLLTYDLLMGDLKDNHHLQLNTPSLPLHEWGK